ncbi:unnamed protein product [Gongylonema pulchrum]|uniref:DUF1981 domain-containing protein n=1 Tax=Gongylonema pulchrum TaxID=637853 RepID=A0A183E2P6_9BILA|nr:unnamed protein product [Gongylonema pulchrum]
MCSEESQEQIVTLLATFVHSNANMIGSGWRPLFSTLKALRIESHNGTDKSLKWVCRPRSSLLFARIIIVTDADADNDDQLKTVSSVQATVLDIFSAYLNIRNTNVLLATFLDYITCVLQYLQSTEPEEEAAVTSTNITVASTALQNLLKVERMLHDLLNRADTADPHLLQRLTMRERDQQFVERHTDASFLVEPLSTVLIEEPFFDVVQPILPTDLDRLLEVPQTNSPWENYTAPMRSCVEIYLSLLEGLTAVTFVCPVPLQSNLLRTIADLIEAQISTDYGSVFWMNFGAYGLSVLVFPMLQRWLRKETAEHENNLKQALGLCTEIVKQYVLHSEALFDALTLLTECVACASNRIARRGYACLRFLIRSTIHKLTRERWTIVVRALWNATSLTLAHLRLLMRYYVVDSEDPNGDVGDVRIAATENSKFSCETVLLAQKVISS